MPIALIQRQRPDLSLAPVWRAVGEAPATTSQDRTARIRRVFLEQLHGSATLAEVRQACLLAGLFPTASSKTIDNVCRLALAGIAAPGAGSLTRGSAPGHRRIRPG